MTIVADDRRKPVGCGDLFERASIELPSVANKQSLHFRLPSLTIAGADVRYSPAFHPRVAATRSMHVLMHEIDWEQHHLSLFGRDVAAPRLSCWMGDADAVYTYSRTRFVPRPWTPHVATLRDDLCERLGFHFNSVLANLYRDGRDSMGWHSDDEPELGSQPLIASLSFGAQRTFRMRACATREPALSIELAHGSVLLMGGDTQTLYQHALPKRLRVTDARINLTFRMIGKGATPR
ncbi:MAG: alpha-ketoglutarate-dependent dioxygenase AlkB [Dokdonella sp.]|uniref:alpha-ketoglutarate-dependent dioxygenase AlkB family protein n=1 Tax=Dokdonella sp. TaxID=2291710 RepID=UPI0032635231